jgi:hypothetical protein
LLNGTLSHQLFLALTRSVPPAAAPSGRRRGRTWPPKDTLSTSLATEPGQFALFSLPRDLSRANRENRPWSPTARHTRPDIDHVWHTAGEIAELRGWSASLLDMVGKGTAIALICRPPGEPVPHSELLPLGRRKYPVVRIADVLTHAGLLTDDRPDQIEQNWRT